ncbi:hypothetical protein [Desulfosporosinus sp.]|uniref:metallophosphoesterase family protein n=1 Tax=Desulfosporosinus sp. TaxID=157907 RepID=UPI00230D8713|nr:hypothetical protein [Desulfosporosinus sp.]MDA8223994.1 hypothetical protein [Desulfitobacterium hafniense]
MTSCLRFLQCAGFRFDSPFWDGPESWTKFRNQDLWQSFQAVLELCQSEKIEFLFLTGDLFEQEYVRKETVERVARSLAKLEGTRVFITPGRRDPLIISSAYRLTVWPSNVHIFSSGVTSVRIPSHNVTVYGAGWTAYHQERPFLDSFQPVNDGTLQLMLLHAMVDSNRNTEGFIPIRHEQVSSSGLDYLALGSLEGWSGVQQAGKTNWADCGSPEARSFQDTGPHGVLLGEIQKDSSRFEFRELGQRCYIEKNFTIQSQSSIEGIAEKIIAETSLEERQKNLYRIKLSGNLLDVEEWVQRLQNLLMTQFRFVTVLPLEERTHSQLEFSGLSRQKSMEGFPTLAKIFINKLQARFVNADKSESSDYWEIVQKIGLTALGQGRTVDED